MATELLGYDAEKWAVFNIAIQPGAILAVLVLYWRTFWEAFTGLLRWDPKAGRVCAQPAGRVPAGRRDRPPVRRPDRSAA
jgi:undecaprenyl pyrophosphate phosphatase UppP